MGIEEFDQVLETISQMRRNIKQLQEQERTGYELRKKAELEKLMYQINPHFVLNTLYSVQWMAQRINSLLEYMQYGYALIAYRKQDGSFYMGKGTLVSYESDFKKKHDMTSIKAHVAYWDAEQQGWRTFLIENFMEWRPIVN